ncbi:flagellar protein [Pelagivirga sediminicola]|uniref:Flagellar protein n=1 Tax=Pelagivirga sediminicola TaxID=2170575 RepID=A0A2T7G5K0_9RHOB|nr:DUF1217 domain-containing protein [Pelagivirga sediminicola]PVA09703.1 flagellar protein [Pelagivirga sediminicola]
MSFQPVIPTGGLTGWNYLNRTLQKQTQAFDKSPQISRDTEYFEKNISKARTADDLVSDRRLLRVALGAFGLSDDLNSTAFVRTILAGGTDDKTALANKLSDVRYREFSKAFGFGDAAGPQTSSLSWARDIVSKFQRREFEVAVGEQDRSMRLAMDAKRSLPDIAGQAAKEETRWLKILGNPPLREVFETALGLPSSFGQADLDMQIGEFSDRAKRQLGIDSLAQLSDPALQEVVIERFLMRDQIKSFDIQSSGTIALTLLQSMPRLF